MTAALSGENVFTSYLFSGLVGDETKCLLDPNTVETCFLKLVIGVLRHNDGRYSKSFV